MRKKSEKQKARETELARIYARDGCVRASVLFEESVSPDAPFHDVFEWDLEKCFKEHNLAIARRYIRITPYENKDGRFSKFANVPKVTTVTNVDKPEDQDLEGHYEPTKELVRKGGKNLDAAMEGLLRQFRGLEMQTAEYSKAAHETGQHDYAHHLDYAIASLKTAILQVQSCTSGENAPASTKRPIHPAAVYMSATQ